MTLIIVSTIFTHLGNITAIIGIHLPKKCCLKAFLNESVYEQIKPQEQCTQPHTKQTSNDSFFHRKDVPQTNRLTMISQNWHLSLVKAKLNTIKMMVIQKFLCHYVHYFVAPKHFIAAITIIEYTNLFASHILPWIKSIGTTYLDTFIKILNTNIFSNALRKYFNCIQNILLHIHI